MPKTTTLNITKKFKNYFELIIFKVKSCKIGTQIKLPITAKALNGRS
jgi:hypothetical protein